jgi:hypothetical protein
MSISRRDLLKTAALKTAVFVSVVSSLPAVSFGAAPRSGEPVSHDDLSSAVGTSFLVTTSGGREVTLRLDAVHAVTGRRSPRSARTGIATEGTIAVFTGDAATAIDQDVVTFCHGQVRRFDALIVPVVSRHAARSYEVVFNRLVSA